MDGTLVMMDDRRPWNLSPHVSPNTDHHEVIKIAHMPWVAKGGLSSHLPQLSWLRQSPTPVAAPEETKSPTPPGQLRAATLQA